jgi:hypothetical protein
MKKAQLFSQDILFAIVLVLFVFSLWLILRDRVLHVISVSEDRREIDEAASDAMSQLLESAGRPTNWNRLSAINETTVESIGLVGDRNILDSDKVAKFVDLADDGGTNYTTIKKLLGLDKSGYKFNFTISTLSGGILHSVNYTPSTSGNASYAALNTTAFAERFALLNNSMVKVTLGVWIE